MCASACVYPCHVPVRVCLNFRVQHIRNCFYFSREFNFVIRSFFISAFHTAFHTANHILNKSHASCAVDISQKDNITKKSYLYCNNRWADVVDFLFYTPIAFQETAKISSSENFFPRKSLPIKKLIRILLLGSYKCTSFYF